MIFVGISLNYFTWHKLANVLYKISKNSTSKILWSHYVFTELFDKVSLLI